MKTTVEIQDQLFVRAQRRARQQGTTLRSLMEEGLRRVLDDGAADRPSYDLPDCSVGEADGENPLEGLSWGELRDEIYAGR